MSKKQRKIELIHRTTLNGSPKLLWSSVVVTMFHQIFPHESGVVNDGIAKIGNLSGT